MDLFVINRYIEQSESKNVVQEDEILSKLLKKAEKKKRKLEKLENEKTEKEILTKTNNEVDPEQDSNPVEKHKKLNEDVEESTKKIKLIENNYDSFKILGEEVFRKKQKVEAVLPPWLAYPTIVSNKIAPDEGDEDESIESLSFLHSQIKENLQTMNIKRLFPIQKEVVPWVLRSHSLPLPFRPRDICVSAPTGSGKTLAFAIPIVQLLMKRLECKIRALIILPVRELALQIYNVFKSLIAKTKLRVCLLSTTYPFEAEQKRLVEYFRGKYYSKVDIIVATPGRLVEHLHSTKGLYFKDLKFLVIDEADRILDQIHHNWLYHLDNHVKETSDSILFGEPISFCLADLRNDFILIPHKMLFSATLSSDPEKLQSLHLFQPKLFTTMMNAYKELVEKIVEKFDENKKSEVRGAFVGKYTTPAELTEKYCITESTLKPLTLYSLIKENSWNKFLCFTNSAEGAHRLAFVLKKLFSFDSEPQSISEISASLSQKERTEILNSFVIGRINGLICSDALARGIDIPDVDIVISYDLSRHIKTYIHRIGRTARAGRKGTAITMLTPLELQKFNKLLSDIGKEVKDAIRVESNLEEENARRYSQILNELKKNIEKEKRLDSLHKSIKTKPIVKDNVQNPSNSGLSIMERIQMQAHTKVANNLETKIENIKKKKNKKQI